MPVALYHINAFSQEPFAGNPACVLISDQPKSDAWMRQVTTELNQPVSCFVYPIGKGEYSLRWFSPLKELDLCGHGTLGAAHILWERNYVPKDYDIHFNTNSGTLLIGYHEEGIQMTFPSDPSSPTDDNETLIKSFNIPLKNVEKNQQRYIVELEDESKMEGVTPNLKILAQLPVAGVIVTSSTSSKYDFIPGILPQESGLMKIM